MLGRATARSGSRYIGSGEAASYRRLPPLGPIMALSWHVPLPVLRGPLAEPSAIDCRRLRSFTAESENAEGEKAGARALAQARFDRRGYATAGSVRTFT